MSIVELVFYFPALLIIDMVAVRVALLVIVVVATVVVTVVIAVHIVVEQYRWWLW